MEETEGLVRTLRVGHNAAKVHAVRVLGDLADSSFAYRVLIAEAGGIPLLVDLLRNGSADAKAEAARALSHLLWNPANRVLITEAGGIPLLVELLRDGSAFAKEQAVQALYRACTNEANGALIAEAGGVPPLVELLRGGSAADQRYAALTLCSLAQNHDALIAEAGGFPTLIQLVRDGSAEAKGPARSALQQLAYNNDANKVAVAVDLGLEALVELARRGRVTVDEHLIVPAGASVPAKRKAALVVATLLRDYVPGFKSAPRDIKTAIASYL